MNKTSAKGSLEMHRMTFCSGNTNLFFLFFLEVVDSALKAGGHHSKRSKTLVNNHCFLYILNIKYRLTHLGGVQIHHILSVTLCL